MSGVGLKCPNCGSSNVEQDDLYSQTQMVCVDCGSVVSEGVLANDPVGGSDVMYSQTTSVAKKPCTNLIKGLQRVRALCRVLRVNREIEELSQTYYNQVYQSESFIKVSLVKKEVLAGCCVLISCRLLNWPITMGTISNLLEADPMIVGPVYVDTVRILNISIPILSVTDVMDSHCQEYKLSSEHVPEVLAANANELTKRALALVELAAKSWIVTGRRPIPLMMAATYLSWQSLLPVKQRLKTSLEKFCQIAKVKKNKTALKRVIEIKEMLCKLGKEIPWEKQAVTPDNVLPQVEDILNYRYALMKKAMKTFEDTLQVELEDCAEGSQDKETGLSTILESVNPSNTSCGTSSQPEIEQQSNSEDGSGYKAESNCEPNWGKRVLFAPPCVVNAKKRKRVQSDNTEVTGDEEISDSEIDSYIRTPREVREIALSQKLLCSTESKK